MRTFLVFKYIVSVNCIYAGVRQWIGTVVAAEERRTQTALLAVTQQAYQANTVALKWGRHWHNLTKKRGVRRNMSRERKLVNEERELCHIGAPKEPLLAFNFGETPQFYEGFKELKITRPAPKIPSFFVQKQYYK